MTEDEQFKEVCHDLVHLMVMMGLLGSVIHQYPEEVQENFRERLSMVSEWANSQSDELQSFGESWDED